MGERWKFLDDEGLSVAQEFLDYRHPSNMMKWVEGNVLELEEPSETTRQWIRSLGAVFVDGPAKKAEPGGSKFTQKPMS